MFSPTWDEVKKFCLRAVQGAYEVSESNQSLTIVRAGGERISIRFIPASSTYVEYGTSSRQKVETYATIQIDGNSIEVGTLGIRFVRKLREALGITEKQFA
jgi:hypothetical protein